MKLIIWIARNPIAANFLMLLIIAGGMSGLMISKRYTVPPAPQNQLKIEIAYPSAGPSEVEQALCIPIEEAIHELEGIKAIHSTAHQGQCEVIVEFDPTIGSARFQAAVQAKIDAVTVFPQGIEKLKIQELKTGTPAVVVAVRGDADVVTLQRQRDQLRAMLSKHPDIGTLISWPQFPYEISIEITESDLRRYGLSFEEIALAIQSASKNIPAGELKNADGKLLLRSKKQAMTVDDFAAIALRSTHQGIRLLLGDVAQIRETVTEQDLLVTVDGKPAVQIFVLPKDRIKTTVEAVNQVIDAFRPGLPSGVDITTWDDWSKYYEQYMSMLQENALSGFILVFLMLMFTLRFHLALWVSSGILISILGALWVMPILGISLNVYSISALILILGVLADDAIVVGENIYTHQQQGRPGLSGAISGTLEVTPLVVLMVLSTMIAFVPGLFLPGLSGYLMYNISLVIIVTLAFSMLEALLILPSHLAVSFFPLTDQNMWSSAINSIQERVDAGLKWFINHVYLPVLQKLLHLRYITLVGFIVMLVITGSLVMTGRIPTTLEAQVNDYYLVAKLEYPPGTPFAEIKHQVLRLEQIANEIRAELNAELGLHASDGKLGDSVQHLISIMEENGGTVDIEIAIDERIRSRVDEIKKRWQEGFGEVPADATLSFQTFWPKNLGMPATQTEKAIELKLIAADTALQSAAGEILKVRLSSYAGVHSVTGSMQAGKPELRLELKPEAAFHGLTMQSLGEQVRHAFFGLEVQRFFQDRDEIRVMLRFPSEHRRSLDNLYNMPIKLPDGSAVPLATVAKAEYAPGFATITRQNRERIQLISAEVYNGEANAEVILADLRATVIPELEAQYPGLRIEPSQSRQKQEEAMSSLWNYGALAILGIYALLAIPLRSYTQPLLIMLAIPFGFIGAVLGHLLLGIPLSLDSYVALFAVGGIVVNDSLILVAKINEAVQKNTALVDAVLLAGRARFRAIFLTTATTFIGLLPLMSEQSSHAEKILPMVVSLAFGVLFSSLVTLLLVPISCVVLKEISDQKLIASAIGKRLG
ncbi:MAG: efflux RND transporter permease subunit [Nitrosomonas sp.]|uniref:efflux RND transporter permease subunit n=1 Tax=Nitrosomonas sp. TaxID=42353 RepID=UPI002733AD17|nr:efflux RND transporter permease subunit [Nitrosomonas sp.]MDP3664113.1 efflux RND transporter permease subunit [Nitrosomonas sp.]MDZ4107765.1 efflux RND transporter permease subunit [Nitrosomonas sp.]